MMMRDLGDYINLYITYISTREKSNVVDLIIGPPEEGGNAYDNSDRAREQSSRVNS